MWRAGDKSWWFVGCLFGRLVRWSVRWSINQAVGRLVGRLVSSWLVFRLVGWLMVHCTVVVCNSPCIPHKPLVRECRAVTISQVSVHTSGLAYKWVCIQVGVHKSRCAYK